MSTIFGIFARTDQDIPAAWLGQMKQALLHWRPDRTGLWSEGPIGLGHLMLENTPESLASRQPHVHPVHGHVIVFDGRLDNRAELAHMLGARDAFAGHQSDEWFVLEAYLKWSAECCARLVGDFAFAVWDPKQQELFLARDPLGVRPLFVAQTDRTIAFASEKKGLLALPFVDRSLNEQWIADVLVMVKVSKADTCYRGIESFPPAHVLQVDRRSAKATRYWHLDENAEVQLADDAAYVERFRELLTEAVRCRVRSHYPIASELSGGLDSTTVASIASRCFSDLGRSLRTFSHVLAPEHEGKIYPYHDEKPWINELLEHAGIENHVFLYARDRPLVDELESNADLHDGPSRLGPGLTGYEMFEGLKAQGARTLLSGFGGDQLVSSDGAGFVQELAESRHFFRLWQELGAEGLGFRGRTRALASHFARTHLPALHSLLRGSDRGTFDWTRHLTRAFPRRPFVEEWGYPQRAFDNPTRPRQGTVRAREHHVILSPHILYRLEDGAIDGAAHGFEYRHPLLDVRLLAFCLALPLLQKRRDGVRRRMIRLGTKGILPERLRWRADKSWATVPNMMQRYVRDHMALYHRVDALRSSSAMPFVDHKRLLAFCQSIGGETNRNVIAGRRGFQRAFQLLYTLRAA